MTCIAVGQLGMAHASVLRHNIMCRTPRSAVAVGHVGEAESTSAAAMQLGNGRRLSVTSRTSPSSCRNRAAGTWAAHMPSGPRVGPRASRMLGWRAVQEAERRCRRATFSARPCEGCRIGPQTRRKPIKSLKLRESTFYTHMWGFAEVSGMFSRCFVSTVLFYGIHLLAR